MNKQEFAAFVESLPDDIAISVDKLDEYFLPSAVQGEPLMQLNGERVRYALIRLEQREQVNEQFPK